MKEEKKKAIARIIAFIIVLAFAATGVGMLGVSMFFN